MAAAVAVAQVTPGAVAAIAEHGDGKGMLQPVLQFLDVRMIKNPSIVRYRMELSDGVYSLQALLNAGENRRARDGSIRNGSIICLREFTCNTVHGRRIIIVLKFDILQSEHGIIGNPKPFDETKNVRKEQRSGTTSVNQGMLAEIPWKTVSEITSVLGYMVKPASFTVKATLSVVNFESVCYAAGPLVVNGNQCDGAVSINGYGWWNCDGCNMTFVACDYRYMIFVQLADSTGEIYATTSQEVGEKIFGQTARELYFMKYEKQDHAQYNKIVMGVQNCEYIFDVKLSREAFGDESETLPMFTIVKVEPLNPSAENSPLVRRTSVGMITGFSVLEAQLQQGMRNFSNVSAINAAGVCVCHICHQKRQTATAYRDFN